MPDPVGLHDSRPLRERLQHALGDAYSIERELGGGMSRVFAARELRLDRVVVVKVLPPELGAALSGERFRREISLAARLQHPHIVPVHAAGEVEGIPWYTMPFIEGQSLRERLIAGALPVADVVRVLHDVADALAYAHDHGVVHRDIKPDNILLTRGHAVVTDFGVAKAVVAAAGGDHRPAHTGSGRDPFAAGADAQTSLDLHRHAPGTAGTTEDGHRTAAGLAIGTPAYMAPEQAAGDPRTDHRADLYALGIVAWEMLTGRAVFGRRPPHELLAAQLTEHPIPVAELRPDVPEPLAELVARCLEKHPGDRPRSAAELRDAIAALGGALSSGSGAARASGGRLRTRLASRWPIFGAVAAGIVAMAAGAWFLVPQPAPLDDDVVAVVPFEVTAGSSLGYLREGMLDLLAAKLTGEGGPRSAEPRAVLAAWRRAAGSDTGTLPRDRMLQLAERLGAGQLLMGEISGDPEHVVLAATVVRVRDGRVVVTEQEQGVVDSLPQLLDRLVGRLLARSAGEGERLPMLSRTSLPALRAYLAAQSAYRHGRYKASVEEFARAVEADSTFTLAALGLVEATDWVGDLERRTLGARLAWAGRDALPERERARLESVVGPRGPGKPSTYREQHEANQRYARLAPDRPEAVFRLGDGLFHYGRAIGIRDADAQARLQLQRTLTLDTAFAPALEHLALLAARDGDTTSAAEFGRRFLAVDPGSESAEGVRWRLAAMRGDRAALEALLPRVAARGSTSLSYVHGAASFEGVAPDLAARVLQEALRRPELPANERSSLALAAHDLALARGRPKEAAEHLRRGATEGLPPVMVLRERVKDALYWDGDTVEAARAVDELARTTPEASLPVFSSIDSSRNVYHFANVCVLERWRLGRGDTSTARRSLAAMRAWMNRRGDAPASHFVGQCALTIDAQLAVLQRAPDAKARVARLDSMLATGPQTSIQEIGNLVVARLREQTGNVQDALEAVRRREYILTRPTYVTTYLREEARLAEAAGDVEGAIAAYRQYLQLRADPEPELRDDVESVRQRLEQLLRQGS